MNLDQCKYFADSKKVRQGQDYANVVSLVSQIVAEMYSNEEILAMREQHWQRHTTYSFL